MVQAENQEEAIVREEIKEVKEEVSESFSDLN